ncbi:hypothetical protein JW921_05890 [Candidatus Fermentibacterales bacterium]|nr:hypothetical protein [Candidatus Fermentibacterales bacterium]
MGRYRVWYLRREQSVAYLEAPDLGEATRQANSLTLVELDELDWLPYPLGIEVDEVREEER